MNSIFKDNIKVETKRNECGFHMIFFTSSKFILNEWMIIKKRNLYLEKTNLNSGDLNKAQVYKIPHRDSPHHKIELIMSFNYRICLNQMNTQKVIIIEDQTIKIS